MDATWQDRRWLADVEATAAAIVARAGDTLLGHYRRGVVVEYKDKRQADPVTEADRAVERQVRDEIRAAFPSHGFLGEEGSSEATAAEHLWVLDPLDGTANFAGRLPFFGVSLALLRNGVPVVGCLWVPFAPNLGTGVLRASYGNGARVGDDPLRVSAGPFRPSGPVAVPSSLRWAFAVRDALARRPGEARNLGSICYELAMVAGGGFQYAVFAGPKLWDVAAGVLLVHEAGGLGLTWSRGRWVPLERFVPPAPGKDGRPRTLRDWARPVLVGSPATIRHVAPN
ncbi:MAG: inositol monophosphatase, partial [Chloroflexota bacterium]|nr:inositol monophosphatase [Chloroflexota bacterium]